MLVCLLRKESKPTFFVVYIILAILFRIKKHNQTPKVAEQTESDRFLGRLLFDSFLALPEEPILLF